MTMTMPHRKLPLLLLAVYFVLGQKKGWNLESISFALLALGNDAEDVVNAACAGKEPLRERFRCYDGCNW